MIAVSFHTFGIGLNHVDDLLAEALEQIELRRRRMAVEQTVGLDDRNRRQSVAGDIGIEILDVLVVRAQRRVRHDLRRIQERIADIAERAAFTIFLAAVPTLTVVLPGHVMLGEQQPDVVLRGRRNRELSWAEWRRRTVAQVTRVVVVDEVVGVLLAVAALKWPGTGSALR